MQYLVKTDKKMQTAVQNRLQCFASTYLAALVCIYHPGNFPAGLSCPIAQFQYSEENQWFNDAAGVATSGRMQTDKRVK